MIQQIPFRKHCYIKKAKALTEQLKIYMFLFQNVIGKDFLDLFFAQSYFAT